MTIDAATALRATPTLPLETLRRPLHDLRISVTDRCNFRCVYRMPKEVYGTDWRFFERSQLLTFEEIERLARIFVRLGVQECLANAASRSPALDGPVADGLGDELGDQKSPALPLS